MQNLAFIDGQNLHMGTKISNEPWEPWEIDLKKFRIYLKSKYKINKAYYFLGCKLPQNLSLYKNIKEAGFILKFREHDPAMLGKKKGNVDPDIIFYVMEKIYFLNQTNRINILIVSGDGDYKMLIDFLISINCFIKILFPNRKYSSSLYKKLSVKYFDCLENQGVKNKIIKYSK